MLEGSGTIFPVAKDPFTVIHIQERIFPCTKVVSEMPVREPFSRCTKASDPSQEDFKDSQRNIRGTVFRTKEPIVTIVVKVAGSKHPEEPC